MIETVSHDSDDHGPPPEFDDQDKRRISQKPCQVLSQIGVHDIWTIPGKISDQLDELQKSPENICKIEPAFGVSASALRDVHMNKLVYILER
jgi:hypothetical protein